MQINMLLMLAWRNLWRNYRRTVIMLLAIITGVWAMIFMTAMMRGMVDDMIESGIRHLPGQIQIHHPKYRDDPSIVNSIAPLNNDSKKTIDSWPDSQWTERLNVPGVVSSEREVRGVQLLGVQPDREAKLAFATEQIVSGRWLQGEDDQGVVIGRKLAERLETGLGKRIVIMSQDVQNNIAERGARIVGLYQSANVALEEERNVYLALGTLQTLLNVGDQVSEIAIGGSDYRQTGALLARVNQLDYISNHSVEVLPWSQIDSYLGSMLKVMDGFVLIWIIVIFLALSFGLVNTLVMAIFERTREIGLMLALGMNPKMILWQVVIEALLLLIIGLLGGNLLAVVSVLPFESGIDVSTVAQGMEMMGANSVLYPSLRLQDMLLANGVVVALGFLASILPARRASHYDPIVALNQL